MQLHPHVTQQSIVPLHFYPIQDQSLLSPSKFTLLILWSLHHIVEQPPNGQPSIKSTIHSQRGTPVNRSTKPNPKTTTLVPSMVSWIVVQPIILSPPPIMVQTTQTPPMVSLWDVLMTVPCNPRLLITQHFVTSHLLHKHVTSSMKYICLSSLFQKYVCMDVRFNLIPPLLP